MKTLQSLVRPNIWNLQPYSSARSEFQGTATVFIDANENPWNPPYNRYPDPLQRTLKARIAEVKGVPEASIFTGNGSDEAIDLLLRIFCEPGVDNIVAIDPSYGMYQVAADINNVACRKVLLRTDFSLDVDALLAAADAQTKLIFLCSPNNPTGNSLDRQEMVRLLHTFEGIVVVDEAYIDFASQPSFLPELENYPNLVVLQTLSKAWGGAALRLGMAFASPAIIGLFNKVKYPYNVNLPAQREALALLNKPEQMEAQRQKVLEERERLRRAFEAAPFQYKVYPSDANFLLVEVGRANEIYAALVEKGVIVRNRNSVSLCRGCLRITVGTVDENTLLLQALEEVGV
ncbi:MAG: histidinol-phosphate transaminase [Parabacteroides sp.]|nr:histidinol-phosphate transaminase [bacterium]MDD7632016.1 histidinol-phosphate transaminase [bacterium]MDY4102272.1 histidinol-phosphate transaminase [Parabacteroides sp.]MDY5637888.1 histidinol-phosphate transaminase [Parabacteroides sp.]